MKCEKDRDKLYKQMKEDLGIDEWWKDEMPYWFSNLADNIVEKLLDNGWHK